MTEGDKCTVPIKSSSRSIRKKRTISYELQKAMAGRIFVYPVFLASIILFLYPLAQSLYITFCNYTITETGYKLSYIGLANYDNVLTQNAYFLDLLIKSLSSLVTATPIIIFFSLFVASMLNHEFRGRGFFRSVFFLPVVVTSGAFVYAFKVNLGGQQVAEAAKSSMSMLSNFDIRILLSNMNLPPNIVKYIIYLMDNMYLIIWRSGVQILLFLSGLQAIPISLYESANVDGCTPWESFWKITMPMIMPTVLVALVYTIVDSLMDYNNELLTFINIVTFKNVQYSLGTTMSWLYFIITFLVLIASSAIIGRFTYYYDK